jgi:tetratricopeptide (TPR) repeat protein
MHNDKKNISIREEELFGDSPCLELDELLNYANGNLSPQKRYRVERHLLDCDLCSLALENLPAFEEKETIYRSVKAVNTAIRERTVQESAYMQHAKKVYFFSAILAFLQGSMRSRYVKFSAIVFSVLILVSVSVLTFKLFQTPTYYEIPEDGGQIRSGANNFFEDLKEPVSETTLAGRYYFQAGQFAQIAQYDSVMVYLAKASELYQSEENWEMYVRCYNALAEFSRIMGNYRQGREYINKAMEVGVSRLGKNHPEAVRSFSISGRIPEKP